MRGVLVQAEDFRIIWPEAKPLIQKALDQAAGEMLIEDVEQRIIEGTLSLWIGVDKDYRLRGACTVSDSSYPRKRRATIVHMGGDLTCLEVLPEIKRWLKEYGYDSVMVWGRRGWEKILAQEGFNYRYACLECEL